MDGSPHAEQRYRDVMSSFATGVTVVTTALEGRLHGLTVNAFCSVSLSPRLVLVSIDQLSQSRPLIAESGIFAVNILSWQQQFLADRFAGRGPLVNAKFEGVAYRTATTGAPLLEGVLAWADCRVANTISGGDHTLFLGEVVDVGMQEGGEALLYYQRRFTKLPQQP